jgi:hypothetical protein
LAAVETEYGIRTGVRDPGTGSSAFEMHFHMPNINQPPATSRIEGSLDDTRTLITDGLFFRVPVDDEQCVSFTVDCIHLMGAEAEAYLARRHHAEETQPVSLGDMSEAILASKMHVSEMPLDLSAYKTFWIEDYLAQCGQGPIAPRAGDHLNRGDVGVVLLRRIYERELMKLATGQPLKQWVTPGGLSK